MDILIVDSSEALCPVKWLHDVWEISFWTWRSASILTKCIQRNNIRFYKLFWKKEQINPLSDSDDVICSLPPWRLTLSDIPTYNFVNNPSLCRYSGASILQHLFLGCVFLIDLFHDVWFSLPHISCLIVIFFSVWRYKSISMQPSSGYILHIFLPSLLISTFPFLLSSFPRLV